MATTRYQWNDRWRLCDDKRRVSKDKLSLRKKYDLAGDCLDIISQEQAGTVGSPNVTAVLVRLNWAHPESFSYDQLRDWSESVTCWEDRSLCHAGIHSRNTLPLHRRARDWAQAVNDRYSAFEFLRLGEIPLDKLLTDDKDRIVPTLITS